MKTKKTLAILLAALLLLSFGCSKKTETPVDQTATEAPAPAAQTATEAPAPAAQTATEAPSATAVAPAPTEEPADVSFTVTDMTGREITFDKPVERAVALSAADCEIIFALGAEETLVGRGEYCKYPLEATEIPSVQSGYETNIEQIIALQPDVLFMATMAQTKEQVEQLEKAGIRVVVSDAQNIEGIYTSITLIGDVMGKQAEAKAIIAKMQAVFDEIKAHPIQGEKTVYFEISPLQWGLWTAGAGTFMNEVAEMMGLKNCFADVQGWAEISEEQVIERNPDFIVTTTMYFGEGPTPETEIMSRAGWENVTAVKEKNILNLTNDELTRPGPSLAEGVQMLYDFVVESLAAMELAPAA